MEKGKELAKLKSSLETLKLKQALESPPSYKTHLGKSKPRSLVRLCLGVLGKHLEDIIEDLSEIVVSFPPDIKMALVAIARRRKLLNDQVLVTLAESSWEILDISGSDVTDLGLGKVVEMCKSLRAIDISRCQRITESGVSVLFKHCHSLETLRWGGCPNSNFTARSCVYMLMPKLKDVDGDSWEELDSTDIVERSHSLRWLIWPSIEDRLKETLATECPRVVVNPKSSPFGFRGMKVPPEACLDVPMDEWVVKDIDPKTWSVGTVPQQPSKDVVTSDNSAVEELSMAERFRLAFVERDAKLAPKRAKNARQHRRRAERELLMSSTDAKSIALAKQVTKSMHSRS
ncbi:hypothetical protein H6P81_006931 [Aristolochia fimbriata]|uniref:RNI-like superfamily protein n=1 Tax=Aristolochia fimbriata TaxID=158543 RepID=A0AAV7EYX1_ARIFI|nr:hypothetical protein H6P81_006931 [Aristolochia fimbriata]